jgi:hypothetical protein
MTTKHWYLLCSLFVSLQCQAQMAFNFELWEPRLYGTVPATDGAMKWSTSDTINSFYLNLYTDRPNVIESNSSNYGAHSGNSALCIQQNFFRYGNDSGFVGGAAYIGNYDPSHFLFDPVAYKGRPTSITGFYRIVGNAAQADTGNITFFFYDEFDAVIGTASKIFKQATAGTLFHQFNLPVTYANTDAVAKVLGKFEVGVLDIVNADTTFKMIIDDVDFVFATDISQAAYQNPPKVIYSDAGNTIHVVQANENIKYSAKIFNTYGQQVLDIKEVNKDPINTNHLASGNYIISMIDKNNHQQILRFAK